MIDAYVKLVTAQADLLDKDDTKLTLTDIDKNMQELVRFADNTETKVGFLKSSNFLVYLDSILQKT